MMPTSKQLPCREAHVPRERTQSEYPSPAKHERHIKVARMMATHLVASDAMTLPATLPVSPDYSRQV